MTAYRKWNTKKQTENFGLLFYVPTSVHDKDNNGITSIIEPIFHNEIANADTEHRKRYMDFGILLVKRMIVEEKCMQFYKLEGCTTDEKWSKKNDNRRV